MALHTIIENPQMALLPDDSVQNTEWVGMPEFKQNKLKEFAAITIRFRNMDDLKEFSALIGQKLTAKSQCTWFPDMDKSESLCAGFQWVKK